MYQSGINQSSMVGKLADQPKKEEEKGKRKNKK